MTASVAPDRRLLELLARSPRGPRRDGLFATWLVCRVAADTTLEPPLPERLARRRVGALERRLSSLAIPAPLRRALPPALAELRDGDRARIARALAQLVAPVGEALGPEAAVSMGEAASRLKHDAPPPD